MSKRTRFITGAAVGILCVAIAVVGWWSLRPDGPGPVDLEAAVARMETAAADDNDGSSASELDDPGKAPSTGPDASVTTSTAAAG